MKRFLKYECAIYIDALYRPRSIVTTEIGGCDVTCEPPPPPPPHKTPVYTDWLSRTRLTL
jgi:hypothetical protein